MPECTIDPYWRPAPSPPAPLREGVVDVWRVDFPGDTPRESTDGVLRALLGDYLGCSAQELRFVRGRHGKPALARGASVAPAGVAAAGLAPTGPAPAVSFNLSHSGPLALLAFTAGSAQLGIDVEVAGTSVAGTSTIEVAGTSVAGTSTSNTRARARDEPALAARIWGAEQARRLRALPPRARTQEFLRLWTAHEAALKCTGAGLSGAAGGHHAAAAQHHPAAGPLWVAELLLCGEHAAAAVAVEHVPTELRFWTAPA
jgi:phosphopantetheinyl transferase